MVGMHVRERNAAFFDRRLQMSNAQRRETLEWIMNLCAAQPLDQTGVGSGCGGQAPHLPTDLRSVPGRRSTACDRQPDCDASALRAKDDDGEMHCRGDVGASTSARTSMDEACGMQRHEYDVDHGDGHCWYQRSQCTPEPNYAARARAATPGCPASSLCVASTDGRRLRSPSAASSGRPLLIRLQRGSGGLADQCFSVETNFGSGSVGLGAGRLGQITRQVEKTRVESWLAKKDRWTMDDRQRDQVRAKEVARAVKTKSVAEHVQLRMLQEERKSMEFREWKSSEEALAKAAAEERDALTMVERTAVAAARRLASLEATRRHEEIEAHQVALQHLGRLEQAARRIEVCHWDDERRVAVARLQHTKRASHATAEAQRTAAIQSVALRNKATADALRSAETKWEARIRKEKKENASQTHDYVRKLRTALRQGASNARDLLEMRNASRHNAVKKESTRVESMLQDRAEASRASARRLAEEVRLSSPPREGRDSPMA